MGKGIERVFLYKTLSILKDAGIQYINADYYPTPKNGQVQSFYDSCGFKCVKDDTDGHKSYALELNAFMPEIKPYYHINVQ